MEVEQGSWQHAAMGDMLRCGCGACFGSVLTNIGGNRVPRNTMCVMWIRVNGFCN